MKTIVWIASLALVVGCSADGAKRGGTGGNADTPVDEKKSPPTSPTTGGGDVQLLPPSDRTVVPPGVLGNDGTDPAPTGEDGEENGAPVPGETKTGDPSGTPPT